MDVFGIEDSLDLMKYKLGHLKELVCEQGELSIFSEEYFSVIEFPRWSIVVNGKSVNY